ncbi:hypothetical protein SAMN05192532_10732 [Alteribacillus iranensis]|uniref:Uncharacterized protein n=1 Tax=Alteribacillus iranensis TaxID=930128 RepID=A0A1I2EWW1_9BACI|nr:hypothetical protein SAMN05192532_10732 [Alteribacillus iranensis]
MKRNQFHHRFYKEERTATVSVLFFLYEIERVMIFYFRSHAAISSRTIGATSFPNFSMAAIT